MKYIALRNLKLSSDSPKICVPIMGRNKEEVIEQLEIVKKNNPDVIEFRADFLKFTKNTNTNKKIIKEVLEAINEHTDIPIIFTIRTSAEGGALEISFLNYCELNIYVAQISSQYNVTLIDVEGIKHGCNTKKLIEVIHDNGGSVIVSNHNFSKDC